jgi:3-deoxy-D-manno-octulosonate 8-phosphate phosphatase (KDO 8-P phosphatase)
MRMIDYKKIKVVSFDCDGVLTDGIYQVDKNGDVTKSFYTRDFCGIQMLLEEGIRVAIITQSHDIIIKKQIERICSHSKFWKKKYDNFHLIIFTGINDKKKKMEEYLDALSLTFNNLAHMGDAENDLELLEVSYYTACPADAIKEIEDVSYRCDANGGRGAVHEFCKHLLEMKNANTTT